MCTPSLNVLLVEANLGDARLIREMLAEATADQCKISHVERISDALERLTGGGFDVVLLDLSLPDDSGLEIVERIRNGAPAVPIVVLTGNNDQTLALRAVQTGAQDYLVKGEVQGHSIARVIRYAVERERIEKAHRMTQFAFDTAGDAIYWENPDGAICGVNGAVSLMLGYCRDELLRMRAWDIEVDITEADWPESWARLKDAGSMTVETQYRARDGRVIPVEITVNYVRFGEEEYAFGCVRDITERKRVEGALRRKETELREHRDRLEEIVEQRTAEVLDANKQLADSEEGFRRIFEYSGDAIFVVDPASDEILEANPSAYRLLEYSPEELLLTPLSAIYPDETAAFQALGSSLFQEGGTWTGQLTCRSNTGENLVTEVSATHIDIDERRCILAIVRDITDRKRVQEQLERAKEAAEVASRAKSQFLANMSHELRTPLNGVIGMSELLLGTDLDEQQRRYAWLAKSSGDVLLSLINDVLDFSKIEAGKLELETIDFDLQYAVESVAAALASKAGAKGLKLVAAVHPQVPTLLRGDPGRLQQILMNLTNNAVKFSEEGEVVVRATLDKETSEHATVRFTVTDSGMGIPPDRRDRLFKSFSKVDASTTRGYGGTGLGLAICRQLVELMGGRIGVESEPGKGSTFWFTVSFEKQAGTGPRPRPVLDDLRHVRVLAVDDDATNREILHEQLSACGLYHRIAADGEEALARLREAVAAGSPFGLAILDMQMPEMDGVQLAQAIKNDPQIEDTVLILLTSMHGLHDVARMKSLGFAACLSKPVRQAQLLDALAEAIARAQSSGARVRRQMQQQAEATRKDLPAGKLTEARILVAEDHEVSQEIAVTLLTAAGFHCEVAANGRQAVEAVSKTSYDLILMDCQMPEMDGFEATRAIRRAEMEGTIAGGTKSPIPIVALTANAVKGDRERCLAAGMDDYLTKPLNAERLLEVINAHLQPAGRGSATEADDPSYDMEAPVAEGSPLPIDGELLLKRWSGHEGLVRRILTTFAAQAGADLAQIERSIAAGDAGQTERLAHGLKGAAGYIAAGRVYELAAQLETMGRAAESRDTGVCVERLREELNRCLDYIPQLLAEVGTLSAQGGNTQWDTQCRC